MRVNGCGLEDAEHITGVAWGDWERREGRHWSVDCPRVERRRFRGQRVAYMTSGADRSGPVEWE
jgi:hypothetical protein